jgi:hypothetical protein
VFNLNNNYSGSDGDIETIGSVSFTPNVDGLAIIMGSAQGIFTWDGTGTNPQITIIQIAADNIQNTYTRNHFVVGYGSAGTQYNWAANFNGNFPVTADITYTLTSQIFTPVGMAASMLVTSNIDHYFNLVVTYPNSAS